MQRIVRVKKKAKMQVVGFVPTKHCDESQMSSM
jgi:hypothetical protein